MPAQLTQESLAALGEGLRRHPPVLGRGPWAAALPLPPPATPGASSGLALVLVMSHDRSCGKLNLELLSENVNKMAYFDNPRITLFLIMFIKHWVKLWAIFFD